MKEILPIKKIPIVFKRDWIFTLNSLQKLLVFSLLGVSLSFGICFSIIDFVSLIHDSIFIKIEYLALNKKFGLIETSQQVSLVFLSSIILGLTYAFILSFIASVGEKAINNYALLSKELSVDYLFSCLFGLFWGLFASIINEILRNRYYNKDENNVMDDEFQDQIKSLGGYSKLSKNEEFEGLDGV